MLHVDGRKHALDVSLLPASSPAAAAQPAAGTLLLGRVTAVAGGSGVRLQLSARSTGRVALTDIHDAPVQHALAGLKAGQYCRAAVLGPDPAATGSKRKGGDSAQLLLSLRPSAGGQCAAHAAAQQQQGDDTPQVAAGPLQAGQLKQGQRVREVVWRCSGNCPMLYSAAVHDGYANTFLPACAHLAWRRPLAPLHVSSASLHCWTPPSPYRWLATSSRLVRLACLCPWPATWMHGYGESAGAVLRMRATPILLRMAPSAAALPAAAQYYRGVMLL